MSQAADAPRAAAPTRKAPALYWSIRREIWENRSITIAPTAAAALVFAGFVVSAHDLPSRARAALAADPSERADLFALPLSLAAAAVLVAMLVTGLFYCLDALHGERRDRSILFWKSLPVSDETAVLAKALIPLAVLPLVAFTAIAVAQLAIMLVGFAILSANGLGVGTVWADIGWFEMLTVLLYGMAAATLWTAPVYAWLLMVSGWARRAMFLWAVLPPLALALLERIAFGTMLIGGLLKDRAIGGFTTAFTLHVGETHPAIGFGQIDPAKLLVSSGLWGGLGAAAVFLGAAIWLRHHREPL